MGFNFKQNFNHPYLAISMSDFWSRWHISLSSWFRDYVYIPLGGNRVTIKRHFINLWITMILSGLWHGASWTFIAWGAFHALFLTFEKIFGNKILSKNKFLQWGITFVVVLTSWVFFRAETISQAIIILKIMFSFSGKIMTGLNITGKIIIFAVVLRHFYCLSIKEKFVKSTAYEKVIELLIPLVIVIIVFFRGPGGEFIYFQF